MSKDEAYYNIALLKDALGGKVTDLARMIGVSRQTIYTWMGGGNISDTHYYKLKDLSAAVDIFTANQRTLRPFILNRPILDDVGFVVHVERGKSARVMAERLVTVIRVEQEQRERLALRLAGRPRPDFSEAGVPMLNEEAS